MHLPPAVRAERVAPEASSAKVERLLAELLREPPTRAALRIETEIDRAVRAGDWDQAITWQRVRLRERKLRGRR